MSGNHKFIEFQKTVDVLCNLRRTGWVMRGVPDAETVAAHSWRMALMAFQKEQQLTKMRIDVSRVVEMCLLHDMGEAVIGDIVPEHHQAGDMKISREEKKMRETRAVYEMAKSCAFPQLKDVFDEYEAQQTPEAVAVKNLDKMDMILQAYEYLSAYPELQRLHEFMACNAQDVTMPLFQTDLAEIKHRQGGSGVHKNEFIDFQIQAGKLKHKIFQGDITIAAHCFRMAVTALYFKEKLSSQNTDADSVVRTALTQYSALMRNVPAEEITDFYTNEEKFLTYLEILSKI